MVRCHPEPNGSRWAPPPCRIRNSNRPMPPAAGKCTNPGKPGPSSPYSLSESAPNCLGEQSTVLPRACPDSEKQSMKVSRETVAGVTLAYGKKDAIHFDASRPGV